MPHRIYVDLNRRLVTVMLVLNYARQVFLLPLTSTTVACLIGFQGTDPLNILLNALATVFILEVLTNILWLPFIFLMFNFLWFSFPFLICRRLPFPTTTNPPFSAG